MLSEEEMLIKVGRKAYGEFLAQQIAMKVITRMTMLKIDFDAIDKKEEMRGFIKATKKALKDS